MPIKLLMIVIIVLMALPAAARERGSAIKKASTTGKSVIAELFASGAGQIKSDAAEDLEFVGSALWREHIHVRIKGNYAFLAMTNGLQILDIGNPASPQLVTNLYIPDGPFMHLVVLDDVVFLAGNGSMVYRIDVSNVHQPRMTGAYDAEGYTIRGLDIAGNYAYISRTSHHLESDMLVLDIGSGNFSEIAQYPYAAEFIRATENYVITGSADCGGFVLLDNSNPGEISELSCTPLDGNWSLIRAELADTLLYFTVISSIQPSTESAMLIYNIKDPEHPAWVSTVTFEDNVLNCVVSGELAYVSNGVYGVQIFDISDPANPDKIGNYLNPGYLYFIAVADSVLYGCDVWPVTGYETVYDTSFWGGAAPGDFLAVNVADPTIPEIMGFYHAPAQVTEVLSDRSFAFCLNKYDSIGADVQIVDLSDPSACHVIGSYSTERGAGIGGYTAGDYFYLATGPGGLEIVDMANKNNPAMVGVCEGGDGAQDVVVDNDFAFVANGTSGLWIWDVSDPEHPQFVTSLPVSGVAESVVESGGYAYVAGAGLHVFDISDPEHAVAGVTLTEYADCHSLAIGDGRLFTLTATGFAILDIQADPEHPALINQVQANDVPNALAYYDGFIALACGGAGVMVYNVIDPANPFPVGTFDTPGTTAGLAMDSGMVYIADTKSLIATTFPMILDADEDAPQTPGLYSLRQNYPNPFNPATTIEYVVPKRSTVTLTVLNIIGQTIRTLVNDTKPAGTYTARWDGRDSHGNQLASGIYLYRIDTGDYTETREMVLLK